MATATQPTLHITLLMPPAGVPYAPQKGSGADFTLNQQQTSTGDDLLFTCVIGLKPGREYHQFSIHMVLKEYNVMLFARK